MNIDVSSDGLREGIAGWFRTDRRPVEDCFIHACIPPAIACQMFNGKLFPSSC